MSNLKRKEMFILIFCLLLGFGLRFYTFDQKSLWLDEVYTFNDSRDGIQEQLAFYKENPTFLHPPLFFVLTHFFYPFSKPERDLRIIPLIFGTLSIPLIYFLSGLISANIAVPCTLSLTFMVYHISLSQDGRSYSLLMFLGMAGLYFFFKHLKTSKKGYLILVALFFAGSFYTSYSSIPFIVFSQILWFYRTSDEGKKPLLPSFLILNGLILLLCLPWIIFTGLNYKGQPLMDPHHTENPGSPWGIIYWILNDWAPHTPLMVASVILLALLPFFLTNKQNAILLLTVFLLPIGGVYLSCSLLNITHFLTSRYFINFLPLFLITIYLSLDSLEVRLKGFMRLKLIFILLLIASNLLILPLYYRSQKQDIRGLVFYLKSHLRPGDKIFDGDRILTPGILHYFRVYPKGRSYIARFVTQQGKIIEYRKSFTYLNEPFTIYYSNTCCTQYVADGSRLWIAVGKESAISIKKDPAFVLKGYFDGSFLNLNKFPSDASIYLFLLDPSSPDEKGIDMPIG
jgi:hypothetical protein